MRAAPPVDFGSEICGSLEPATEREWLVTNGLGGYASGTISGILTRRYHGLLVAALEPPGDRTLLVSKVDESIGYDGGHYDLGANRWADGNVSPAGFRYVTRFQLQETTPVWSFACADAIVEKRIWMQHGANTTFLRYDLLRSTTGSADLEIKVLANFRDFHHTTRAANYAAKSWPIEHGLEVLIEPSGGSAIPFFLLSETASAESRQEWFRNFELAAERARGLDDRDDHFLAGVFRARLEPGKPVLLIFSTDPAVLGGSRDAWNARVALDEKLLEYWVAAQPQAALDAPPWIRQLVLAAEQFTVTRGNENASDAATLIAGYPWFGEWTRDTMIALPGLTLPTGRPDLARSILRTAARSLDQGMLPNFYPERPEKVDAAGGEAAAPPAYNSADATLWYFEALRQYYDATSDQGFIGEHFDMLAEIIDHHVRGTRYGIGMDAVDGLLHAGEPGTQLTWMDARVGETPVSARIGKPVEVNALWYNALRTMSRFAFELTKPAKTYIQMAERTQAGFARFWNADVGYCFDVLDGPKGNDASLRPNQIFTVSLPESPLTVEQRRAVVEICARRFLTPSGLRTLAPGDPRYRGTYAGSSAERDAAYHQGTVWAWLLGPFIVAHLRVYNDPALAASFLEPIAHNLSNYGLGTVNEIFDGDLPFHSRGAIAQAWSVGEVLRAWHLCHEAGLPMRRAAAGKR